MSDSPLFEAAFPYQEDVLALPVVDLDEAARWYSRGFGLREVERHDDPDPTVILERDGIKIGFALNGGDASQDGAAILVSDINRAKEELESAGIVIGNWQTVEQDGEKRHVFFVVAPDGLCYCFYQPTRDPLDAVFRPGVRALALERVAPLLERGSDTAELRRSSSSENGDCADADNGYETDEKGVFDKGSPSLASWQRGPMQQSYGSGVEAQHQGFGHGLPVVRVGGIGCPYIDPAFANLSVAK